MRSGTLQTPKDKGGHCGLSRGCPGRRPRGDAQVFGNIARSKGMTEVAEKAGVARQSLYRALSPESRKGRLGHSTGCAFGLGGVSEPRVGGVGIAALCRPGRRIGNCEKYNDYRRRSPSRRCGGISASFRRRSLVRRCRTSRRRRARLSPLLMSTPAPVVSDSPPYQKPESGEGRRQPRPEPGSVRPLDAETA